MKKIATVILLLTLLCTFSACNDSSDKMSDLRGEYFDFAQKYRLDYIPYFDDSAPKDSSEYLMWAFAFNLDNWVEDKGTMCAQYIEDIVQKHFNATDLSRIHHCKYYFPGLLRICPPI